MKAGTSARGVGVAHCRKNNLKKQTSDFHSEEHFVSRFNQNHRVSVFPLAIFAARTRLVMFKTALVQSELPMNARTRFG